MQAQDGPTMWKALNEANKARASVYVEFFRAIERRLGRETAIEVTREALYNWGQTLADGLESSSLRFSRTVLALCLCAGWRSDVHAGRRGLLRKRA
jgi:hypothetical protein